jgi:heat shock protein HtpX
MDAATTPAADADRLVRRAVAAGILKGVLLAVVLAVVGLVVGAGWLLLAGVLVGVLVAVGWFLYVRSRVAGAVGAVLAGVSAQRLAEGTAPRLTNVVEGLCVASGVSEPEIWTVAAPGANAMALDAGGRTALVVTDGLVEHLGLVELEGAVANLLGRVKDGSARLATTAVAVRRLPMSAVYAPDRLLAEGLGAQYAVRSDLEAVRITRYPPGLRAALDRVSSAGTSVPAGPADLTHLWLAPVAAAGDDAPASVRTSAQPLDLRIAVLDEL